MGVRLHTGGRTRRWLGEQLGGDERLGDRVWRRCLHLGGLLVLLLYVLPRGFFVVLPTDVALVIALGGVLALEALRQGFGLELPTIRPHEQRRIASFAYFAVGLSVAVLVFPRTAAVAAVVGASLIDPAVGELRELGWTPRRAALAGWAGYVAFAAPWLDLSTPWGPLVATAAALASGGILIAVEGPLSRLRVDDDLAMPVLTGLALAVPLWIAAGGVALPAV